MREGDDLPAGHETERADPDLGPPAKVDQAETPPDAAPRQSEDAVESLRELVVFLVENLVENPEDAEVVAEQRGSLVQIRVRLPETELGKVIGRGGRIAKSMRTALMIAGSRHHLRVSLDIES